MSNLEVTLRASAETPDSRATPAGTERSRHGAGAGAVIPRALPRRKGTASRIGRMKLIKAALKNRDGHELYTI
jgi:hypothetical protein